MRLGSPFDILPVELPPPPSEAELVALRLVFAVEQLQAALQNFQVPAPQVILPEPDLAEIVTAVTDLRPGPTADEIAEAIARTLVFPEPPTMTQELQAIVTALEKLDFRMKGRGDRAYGGGSVTIQPNQSVGINNLPAGLALDATLVFVANHFRPAGTNAGATTVTGTSPVTIYTPTAGLKPRVVRYALTQATSGGDTVATVKLGSKTIAVLDLGAPAAHADSSTYEGAADDTMTVTLSVSRTVHANVNAHDWS